MLTRAQEIELAYVADESASMSAVADEFGVTRQRVSQIISAAIDCGRINPSLVHARTQAANSRASRLKWAGGCFTRRSRAPATTWWDDHQEELAALVNRGLTAGQIAKRFKGVTRNAVIGRCHRTGLKLGPR
jgi:hypothetical protein